MLECFDTKNGKTIPITPVVTSNFENFLKDQPAEIAHYCEQVGFFAAPQEYCCVLDTAGNLSRILLGVEELDAIWNFAGLPLKLPRNYSYTLDVSFDTDHLQQLMIAWGLGAYQFCRYKSCPQEVAKLVVPEQVDLDTVQNIIAAIYLVRDLINMPTNDMLPENLAETIEGLAKEFQAETSQIIGDDLVTKNFRGIHSVGRASQHKPRLIDLRWGDKENPKVTLVGKGVCFDSGGLNIKSSGGMLTMKKDMGGAAHAIGLAQMIMRAQLPIRLRLLVPAVENSISGNAYRPGDVVVMRNNKTVEITNTDAEGRMILADALTEASSEDPDLLIDFATLTGAARIALGAEIPALFSQNQGLVHGVMQLSEAIQDPIWPMPLYQPYKTALDSNIADMVNSAVDISYGGSIIAALFLREFVSDKTNWMHLDLMALNQNSKPGRPKGGEAQALRVMFEFLSKKFAKK